MKIGRNEYFDESSGLDADAMRVFDDYIDSNRTPSLSQNGCKEVSVQKKGLTHYLYEEIYIKLEQIIIPAHLCGSIVENPAKCRLSL